MVSKPMIVSSNFKKNNSAQQEEKKKHRQKFTNGIPLKGEYSGVS